MPARGTIVTLGGGGFSMSEDGSSAIDDLLLDLTGCSRPQVGFLPTASGDSVEYSQRFESAFAGRAATTVVSLFANRSYSYTDPRALLDQDVIYVGGGSTANLLALWSVHGVGDVLREAAANGTVLAGISAGMNCWFEASSTDSFGDLAPLRDGLGLLRGSACPHYLGEPSRRQRYLGWVASDALPAGYAIDDYTAIVWRDGVVADAVSENREGFAYRVERVGDEAVEREIPVRMLAPRRS